MSFFNEYLQWSKYCPNLAETVGLGVRNRNLKTLICLMSTLKVATVLPFDALRRKMSSTVIAVYSMDVRSGLI